MVRLIKIIYQEALGINAMMAIFNLAAYLVIKQSIKLSQKAYNIGKHYVLNYNGLA